MSNEMKGVNLQVSNDIVKEIVQAQIATEISKALEGKERLIQELVSQMLSLKTNIEGRVSNYSSENNCTFIEATIGRAVRSRAATTVERWLVDHAGLIEKEVERQLRLSAKSIAKGFANMMKQKAEEAFRVDVTISGIDDKNDIQSLWDRMRCIERDIAQAKAKKEEA